MNVTLNIDTKALTRLNRKLADYWATLKKLTIPEVLDKKGTDLRLQLFKLFREERFGGRSGKKTGIAFRELRKRTKAGRGTFVRLRSLASRWGSPPETSASGRKLSLWQKLVWQEVTRRQSGIGVLSLGFLSSEFRRGFKGPGTMQKDSKTLGPLVRLALTDTSYTIEGFTPGLAAVANRNDIANRALLEVEKDIDKYLDRKLSEAREMVFSKP